METFEKLAETLDTTIEDILSASKDGIERICFVNNFCSLMTLDINGQIVNIRTNECKWIETNDKDFTLRITGDMISDSDFEESENNITGLKDKIKTKFAKKAIRYVADFPLQVNCVYKLTDMKPDSVINIELDVFSLGDKALTDFPFLIAYPKIECDCGKIELLQTKGKNNRDVIKRFRRYGAVSDVGILDFIDIIILYPIRSLYFRHLCKPRMLKKNILKADYYHKKYDKEEEGGKQRKGCGCFSLFLFVFLFFIFSLFIKPLIFMETEKPALVAADYSTITYYGDVYVRIDDLPEYVVPVTFFGAESWESARTDGLSRLDQLNQNNKVTQYKDYEGKAYLWLVEDYADTMLTEDELGYEDFEEHYVYVCENPDKSLVDIF